MIENTKTNLVKQLKVTLNQISSGLFDSRQKSSYKKGYGKGKHHDEVINLMIDVSFRTKFL